MNGKMAIVNAPSTVRPLRRWIGRVLLIALILAATAELGFRGFRRALSDTRDFAVVYASTRAFDAGQNPYDDSVLAATWKQATHNDPRDANPLDLALYPPTTYLLLSPLALLDWAQVRWAWLFVNLMAVAVLVLTLTRYAPGKLSPARAAFAAAFILGFGPIQTAIAKGQLAVVATAILALAFAAEVRNSVIFAAILVSLAAALKPQIAAPIVILYLVQRRWKAVGIVAGVTAGLLCMTFLRLSLAGVSWLPSLVHNVSLAAQPGGVYDPSPANPLVYQLVNGSALFHRLTANQIAVTLLLAAIGASVCFVLWKRGRHGLDLMADPGSWAAVCVLGLVLIAHRYYDAAVLVFVFVWALRGISGWPGWISIAGCLVMAFPLPSLLIVLGHSQAPFAIPQTLWNFAVIQHEGWVLLAILAALTASLAEPRPRGGIG